METILTGQQIQEMLKESIPGYKPVLGPNVEASNKKSNTQANKETLETTGAFVKKNIKDESKPVVFNTAKGEINNNKTNLDLEYPSDPGEAWKERVKKGIEGDPTMGNSSDKDDATSDEGNKEFYKAAKKSDEDITDAKHELETTGLVSKFIDLPKKATAFEGVDITKMKRLNFKNTQFLGENHMFSLIPEDYKKDGSKFIMKDKAQNEYLIEWKVDGLINKGVVKAYENKIKLAEEFNRIKSLYNYKSEEHLGTPTNEQRKIEESKIQSNLDKIREMMEG